MKSTKKFLALALAIGVVSAPMIANAASSGPNEGARKFFGGEYTYATAWSGWYNYNCYLSAELGGETYEATKRDWNQTNLKAKGEWNISHTHGYTAIK